MVSVSQENPVLVGDRIKLEASQFAGISNVIWTAHIHNLSVDYHGRYAVFYQPFTPGQ